MIDTLHKLQYNELNEFYDDNLKDHFISLITLSHHLFEPNAKWYCKNILQKVAYTKNDNTQYVNDVMLSIFFLVDDTLFIRECFAIPAQPFELRTNEDFEALQNLFNVYCTDAKQIMEVQNKLTETIGTD